GSPCSFDLPFYVIGTNVIVVISNPCFRDKKWFSIPRKQHECIVYLLRHHVPVHIGLRVCFCSSEFFVDIKIESYGVTLSVNTLHKSMCPLPVREMCEETIDRIAIS